jgi:hypothetical protein
MRLPLIRAGIESHWAASRVRAEKISGAVARGVAA